MEQILQMYTVYSECYHSKSWNLNDDQMEALEISLSCYVVHIWTFVSNV